MALIEQLNLNNHVSGILIMHPLIAGINEREIRKKICPQKDIEGLNHYYGIQNTYQELYVPCTALGIIIFLEEMHISLKNKCVLIFNRSARIGLPLVHHFLKHEVDVTICHRHTDNQILLKNADIVIMACGNSISIDSRILKKVVLLLMQE